MTVITHRGRTAAIRPDNAVPLAIGWEYNITPGEASMQWVRIVELTNKNVYTEGVDNTIADWEIPIWKFDDLVKGWRDKGYVLWTEDLLFYLATEDGDPLVGR